MYRKVLGLALVAVFAVGVTTAMTQPGQAKDNGESADWQAVEEALDQYEQDQSDENLEVVERAVANYIKRNPDGENYTDAVVFYLRIKWMQEAWEPLIEFAEEHVESSEGVVQVYLLGASGVAHANLGNEEQARAIVERLEAFEENSHEGQVAQQFMSEIDRTLRFRPGAEAPDFTLTALDGETEITLSELRGNYVLLDFWATWCPPCIQVMDDLKPVWEQYESENFEILGVGISFRDTAERQRSVAEERGYTWTKLFDAEGEVAQDYGVTGVPHLVLLDPEGKIIGTGSSDLLDTVRSTLADAFGEADDADDADGAEGDE